jgi:hypothetical protein
MMADSYITPPQSFCEADCDEPSASDKAEKPQAVQQWKTWERRFICTKTTFTKSEISKDELIHRKNGDTVDPFWSKE